MPLFGKCRIDGNLCYASGCICRLNPREGFQTEYSFGKKVGLRNKDCSHFNKVGVEFSSVDFEGHEYDPSVDMSGYVPSDKRVKGACRCSVCSANSA